LAKKLAFFTQTTANFCKKLILTLVFEKNAIFSPKIGKNRRKLAKIAENFDHNIEPCPLESSTTVDSRRQCDQIWGNFVVWGKMVSRT
jgi:hypothetical protein